MWSDWKMQNNLPLWWECSPFVLQKCAIFFFNLSAHTGTNTLLHGIKLHHFSIHVRETTSDFVAWIPNNHTQSAFSFLQPFNQLGLAQLRFESPHLLVGFIPLVFVGIISLLNGVISWVGLIMIVDLFPVWYFYSPTACNKNKNKNHNLQPFGMACAFILVCEAFVYFCIHVMYLNVGDSMCMV